MKKISLLLSLSLALAACQQEELVNLEENLSSADFTAAVEDFSTETKTSLNEANNVVWSEGDEISIFHGNKSNKRYLLSSSAGKSSATFKLAPDNIDESNSSEMAGNVAVYPYGENLKVSTTETDLGYIGIYDLEFPEVQEYTASSFANKSFHMVAVTTDKDNHKLRFKNLMGILKLNILGYQKIKSIKVISNNNDGLSGRFDARVYFDYNTEPTVYKYKTNKYVTLDCGEGVQLDSEVATPFYISLPPTEFTKGFTLEITDTEDNVFIKKTNVKVARSSILSMPEFILGQYVDVKEEFASIPEDGTPVQITVNASHDWQATYVPEWINVSPVSGSAGKTSVSVSMQSNYDAYHYINTYIEFTSGDEKDRVTVLKDRPISTTAAVYDGIDSEEYRLTGVVTSIVNTTYGNWYLTDDTGSLYIYGTTLKGYYKMFSDFNIGVGDQVTVQGPRNNHNGDIELIDASVIDIKKSLFKTVFVDLVEGKIPAEGCEFNLEFECDGDDVSVRIPEKDKSWISLKGIEEIADNQYKATFIASANTGGNRKVEIQFWASKDDQKSMTYTTLLQIGEIIECTIEDFLNAAEDETLYKLTGTITSLVNETYGNFDLTDETGTVYVYGLTNRGEIGTNNKSFSSLGLKKGDTLTLVGKRTSYGGVPQVGGVAYYVSHVSN